MRRLVVVGNRSQFHEGVRWVCRSVDWEQDVRVNLFELNIRPSSPADHTAPWFAAACTLNANAQCRVMLSLRQARY